MERFIVIGLLMFLLVMVLLIEYLSWKYSGWSRLQLKYTTNRMPIGSRFTRVSGVLGLGVFQKSINCGFNREGFFFWQFLYWDGFFHKKILIPWYAIEELHIERERVAFSVQGQKIELISKKLAVSLSIDRSQNKR